MARQARHAARRAAARALLAAVALVWLAPAAADAPEPLVFEGRVEAVRRAALATRIDGVVAALLFQGGEAVEQGAPLIRLDPADAEVALAAAQARRDGAAASLAGAERRAARAEALGARGVAAEANIGRARTERAEARAALAEAEAALRRAALDLERTTIRAPIAGRVSRPAVAVGAFVEAEAGPPLAEIVQLDPALVAYAVPYAARLATLDRAGAGGVEALLAAVRLELRLPGGRAYGEAGRPRFAEAVVDPQTGAVTVWAEFANPDALLRPGMPVTVLSAIRGAEPETPR